MIDAEGFFVRRHHTQVTLRFDAIRKLELEAFNGQNVLTGLETSRLGQDEAGGLHVAMPSSYGMEAELKWAKATVVDVQPITPRA